MMRVLLTAYWLLVLVLLIMWLVELLPVRVTTLFFYMVSIVKTAWLLNSCMPERSLRA